ncbi:MAG: 3-hydroxyacyl-CoA dehydrogenase NAD-binding domain-containing protein [Rhodobacteraceae bacterium]|nr:3-hydroxyacyl-CoA dehydrogenase NAD-binding domain-containing protein [Paracoccaceae bacterium]
MRDFSYSVDGDGIATIAWNVPGRSMNVMSWAGFAEIDALVRKGFADDAVRGIVITSAKEHFAGGMDLKILARMMAASDRAGRAKSFKEMSGVHGILRRIELAGRKGKDDVGKPVVAALNGTTMGIGYELALACHHIVCADRKDAQIGLPEIKVGLFPGAGGTVRLVRRLGLEAAIPFLFKGITPAPRKALAAGLVDQLAEPEKLVAAAKEWILNADEGATFKPWDQAGFRLPGGEPYSRKGFQTFAGAIAAINGATQGVYPAARAMMSAIYEGLQVPFEAAIRIETRWFAGMMTNPSPSSMIRTNFVHRLELRRGARRPRKVPATEIDRMGVIGAGMMGSGIALVAAQAGIEVELRDQTLELARKGRQAIEEILDSEISRNKLTPGKKGEILSRVSCGSGYAGLDSCTLVVEAVTEHPGLKAEVFKQLGECVGDDVVIASNTSSLEISSLAKSVPCPDRFVGTHFFSPVHRMALVEIVRGSSTSDQAIAVAFDFAQRIRKIPIIVNDCRYFYANRCIVPYLREGMRMIGEGVSPALIENSARQIGMPVGPLQLLDEVSIELAVHLANVTRKLQGEGYVADDADKVLFRMYELGRLGAKSGAGFYEYGDRNVRTGIWPGLGKEFKLREGQPPPQQVRDRLLLIQVVAAVKAFEDGILEDVREGDVAAVFGWGFAPWSGGPFQWIDGKGAAEVCKLCDRLSAEHGDSYSSPKLLADYAESGRRFHDKL